MHDNTFLVWYDASKQPTATKITNAMESYRRRFPAHVGPIRVLVHARDVVEVDGAVVEVGTYVQPNNFWMTAA